jgi:predicted PurR-regulated permease PerM
VNATPKQTARTVLTVAIIVGLLYVLWLIRDVVLLGVLAVFVAAALSGPVAIVQRLTHAPRALAILLVYLMAIGIIVAVGLIVVPPLVDQIEEFVRHVPRYIREVRDDAVFQHWDEQYGIVAKLQGEASKLPSLLEKAAGDLESVTIGAAESIAKTIAVLAIAFLLLLDAPRLFELAYSRMPKERADSMRRLAAQAAGAIGGYVAGAFAVAALAGLAAFVAMEVLGIPFAVPLAVVMAFFALIPLVGSAIGAVIIAIVALFEGPGTAIGFVLYFVVYQQLETHVLGPFVYKRTVQMRPVLVIISVFAGASLLGILGALLAIPAAATIQIVLQEWWRVTHPDNRPPADPTATSTPIPPVLPSSGSTTATSEPGAAA